MGVVSALNHEVRPKEIYILASPASPWQESRHKNQRPDAARFWRCLYCLPTAQQQQNCSVWCDGTAECFVPTASRRTLSNTAPAKDTCSGTRAKTARRPSMTRLEPSCITSTLVSAIRWWRCDYSCAVHSTTSRLDLFPRRLDESTRLPTI